MFPPSYPPSSQSPYFRSMYSQRDRSPLMNGLLSANEPSMSAMTPSLPPAPQSNAQDYAPQAVSQPTQRQYEPQPARTEYAKSTPPQTAPQQVWRSPSASGLRYPGSAYEAANVGIAANLLDSPANTVAAPLNMQAPAMPQGSPLAATESDTDAAPPPPEFELLDGQSTEYPFRSAQYLDPIAYQPLQPTRRYEVI